MAASVKVAGTWRTLATAWVKVGGTWRQAHKVPVKVAGAWKAMRVTANISGAWADASGSSPRTTTSNVTVPSGSAGSLKVTWTTAAGSPTVTYSKGGGAFTALVSGSVFTMSNGESFAVRATKGGSPVEIDIIFTDNATGEDIDFASISAL